MAGKRRDNRVEATLPVRIFGMDSAGHPFTEQVRTRNVSKRGALLTGVKTPLKAGDVIGLSHSDRKSRFRVVWIGPGSVGVEDVNPAGSIWVVPVPKDQQDKYMVPRSSQNRRQHPRYKTEIASELRAGDGVPVWGKLSDISAGGCYLEMLIPLPVGTNARLTLWIHESKIQIQGTVVSFHPGYGCGIKFNEMTRSDRDILSHFLEELKASAPPEDRRFAPKAAGAGE